MNKTSQNKKDADELIVSRSNAFINASYQSTLLEKKILALALAKTTTNTKGEMVSSFTTKELISALDLKGNYLYNDIKKVGLDTLNHKLLFEDSESEKFIVINVFQSVAYDKEIGKLVFKFSNDIKSHIYNLQGNFTNMRLLTLTSFNKNYGYRLYELLMVNYYKIGKNEKYTFDIDELSFRYKLGLINTDADYIKKNMMYKPEEVFKKACEKAKKQRLEIQEENKKTRNIIKYIKNNPEEPLRSVAVKFNVTPFEICQMCVNKNTALTYIRNCISNENLDIDLNSMSPEKPPKPDVIYEQWGEVTRRVLEPSVKEINENPLSEILVEYETIKKMENKVSGIRFTIRKNNNVEIDSTKINSTLLEELKILFSKYKFTNKQLANILEVSNNDKEKILSAYNICLEYEKKNDIKSFYALLRQAIKENWKSTTKKHNNIDYDQRTYTQEEVDEYVKNKKPTITGMSYEEIQAEIHGEDYKEDIIEENENIIEQESVKESEQEKNNEILAKYKKLMDNVKEYNYNIPEEQYTYNPPKENIEERERLAKIREQSNRNYEEFLNMITTLMQQSYSINIRDVRDKSEEELMQMDRPHIYKYLRKCKTLENTSEEFREYIFDIIYDSNPDWISFDNGIDDMKKMLLREIIDERNLMI